MILNEEKNGSRKKEEFQYFEKIFENVQVFKGYPCKNVKKKLHIL